MKNIFSLSIGKKIFIGFLIIILLYTIMVVINFYKINQIKNLAEEIIPYSKQINSLQEIAISLEYLSRYIDEFFVIGFMEYHEKANEELKKIFNIYKRLEKDESKNYILKLDKLNSLLSQLEKNINLLIDFEHQAIKSKEINERILLVYQFINSLMQEIRKLLLTTMNQINYNVSEQKRIILRIVNQFIILGISIVAVGIIMAVIISRQISKPLYILRDATYRISQGDLSETIEIKAKDEVGQLAESFNKMLADLQNTMVSKEYVDNIIRSMHDALFVIDIEGKIKTVNDAAIEFFGYSEKELISKQIFSFFCQDLKSDVKCNLNKLKDWYKLKNFEAICTSHDGRNIPVLLSSTVKYNNLGEVTYIICTAKNIEDRKQAEEELQNSKSELQIAYNQLKETNEKLKNTQMQLIQQEKMAAVGQLAGGVSHEINNPLTIILGFAQSIVKRIKDNDPLAMPLKSIEREAIRCKKLVGELLTFSRAAKIPPEIIEINSAIEETLSLVKAQLRVKNIEFVSQFQKDLPRIKVNKNQLQQVIINLCNNAVDSMPNGGKITISTNSINENDKNFVMIKVSDTGKGISKDDISKIFEPFFTTKEVGKGTGLGLSLCYEIIQRHKGTIAAESEISKGTTFTIKLPGMDRKNEI